MLTSRVLISSRATGLVCLWCGDACAMTGPQAARDTWVMPAVDSRSNVWRRCVTASATGSIRSQPVLRVAAGATALASRGVDETVGLTAAAFDVGS
jgi:hypothetical protein